MTRKKKRPKLVLVTPENTEQLLRDEQTRRKMLRRLNEEQRPKNAGVHADQDAKYPAKRRRSAAQRKAIEDQL